VALLLPEEREERDVARPSDSGADPRTRETEISEALAWLALTPRQRRGAVAPSITPLSGAEREAVEWAIEALVFGIDVRNCLARDFVAEDRMRTRGDDAAGRNVRLDTNEEVLEVVGRYRWALYSSRVRNRVHQMLGYGPNRERVLDAIRRCWERRLAPEDQRVASELSRLKDSGVPKAQAVAAVAKKLRLSQPMVRKREARANAFFGIRRAKASPRSPRKS
jgi:hypothetical protein